MAPTYLVGVDGSAAAAAAARFAGQVAQARGAELVLASIYTPPPAVYTRGTTGWPLEHVAEALHERATLHLETIEVPAERVVHAASSVAHGLHELALEHSAALVAVGVTHRYGLGRLVGGSVAEHLLHGAPCPVLVVPADVADGSVRTVGVAYDGEEPAEAALSAGGELAEELAARLVIIRATEPVPADDAIAAGRPDLGDVIRESYQRDLDELASHMPSSLHAEALVLEGDPGSALVRASAGVDLLVAGSRGYGSARGVLLGSVSRHVATHAKSPVLVVPRAPLETPLAPPRAVTAPRP